MVNKHRDATFIYIDESRFLVTACDSCGGIGLKDNDLVKVPYNITGKLTARVCLMEILSLGAKLIGLTVNICNEPNPTGEEILLGIKEELKEIDVDIPITISTEKNIGTSMTALGITALGIVKKENMLINELESGNSIYVAGIPSVGNEVMENISSISNTKHIKRLVEDANINEVIPVGSSGIKGELDKLSNSYGITIDYIKDSKVDLNKSAGPSTSIVLISKSTIQTNLDIPLTLIGKIQ